MRFHIEGGDLSRRQFAQALVLPAVALGGAAGHAADAPLVPVADYFRDPQVSELTLAPGGKHLAGIRTVDGRRNVWVVNLDTRKASVITNFRDGDVVDLRWISPRRLVFGMIDRQRGLGDQQGAQGLFAIDADASQYVVLAARTGLSAGERLLPVGTMFHSRVAENGALTDDILVQVSSMQALGKFASNLHRVDTRSGRSTLLTLGGPGDVRQWVVDRHSIARAAVSVAQGNVAIHYRDSGDAPWRILFKYAEEDVSASVIPLAFDAGGRLYCSAYMGADQAAIYELDAAAGALKREPVFAVKGFDLTGGLHFSPDGTQLLGLAYDADRRGTVWVAPEYGAVQAAVDAELPNRVNRLAFGGDSPAGRVLVVSTSDTDDGRGYLYDSGRKQLTQVAERRPWIPSSAQKPMQFIRYTARDGLSIPAMLTLPGPGGNHPLVVLHYGGPWVRPIEWGWDPHVQFLASRGYAVLMPAPRASTGFGAKLFKAGWKQWGLAMQDDVTDGVLALVDKGVIDRKRVCIAGASYGGYLAMMGLVKEPALFRCGINWVGVTDPSFMFTVTWTDFNRVDAGRYSLPRLIGDPDKDKAQFERTSPLLRAKEIHQPVLMAYGGLDQRVPIINGEKMRDALAGHNKNVEWVVYPDEGHGWLRTENKVDFWTRVERFLAKNMAA